MDPRLTPRSAAPTPIGTQPVVVTSTDRHFGAGVHIASIFFPFLGPLVGYIVFSRMSKFSACHALSALIDEIILKAILVVGFIISLSMTIVNIKSHIEKSGLTFSWDMVWPIVIKMGVTWLALSLLGIYLLIKTLFSALQAYRGEWPRGGISAKIANKWANPAHVKK